MNQLLVKVAVVSFIGLAVFGARSSAAAAAVQGTGRKPSQARRVKNPERHIDIPHSYAGLMRIPSPAPIPVTAVEKFHGEALFHMRPGIMAVSFCTSTMVHVRYFPSRLETVRNLAILRRWRRAAAPFRLLQTKRYITLAGAQLSVRVNRATGAIRFLTPAGRVILSEPPQGGKAMLRKRINGQETYHVEQEFISPPGEALYGMGEKQDGIWNWRGIPVDLINANTVGGTPMLVSSRGYGVLWDNESYTEFNPMSSRDEIQLNSSTHAGVYRAQQSGQYVFFANGGNGFGDIGISVHGVATHNIRNMWVPYTSVVKVHLDAGRSYHVSLLGDARGMHLYARRLAGITLFRSEAGKAINYYFIYGPGIDHVVQGYRALTGQAPLFPQWAFGFWQSREHYSSQAQILRNAAEFRARHIPVDLLVQDWQYWPKNLWGAYQFSRRRYPDPAAMIARLHRMHFHFMISVWSDPKGPVRKALARDHGLIGNTGYVDVFNPIARQIRWRYLKKNMFDAGVDAWWQDGEDAYGEVRNQQIYRPGKGYVSGDPYTLAYPQYANESIYAGQRATGSPKRVVQLGKTCTLGMQRYASATWSGDVHGNWQTLGWQIPAGLNVSIAGIPYWTTDTGGFFRPKNEYTSPSYNHLLVRWFEFSTFSPILRVHGFVTATEMWKWPLAYRYLLRYDRFRYRLLPYTYSLGWRVTQAGYTLMRPLVMDFRQDPAVHDIGNQYMFGPDFMVAPITHPRDARSVYLPKGAGWSDFWSGKMFHGGEHVRVTEPLGRIPLWVRAGSILPLGPVMQYAAQKPENPLELRIYPGADGAFTLYEDQNNGYAYQTGAYSIIRLRWHNRTDALTIGRRRGAFPGMLRQRRFRIVLVRPHHGVGLHPAVSPDRIVVYNGARETIHFKGPKRNGTKP